MMVMTDRDWLWIAAGFYLAGLFMGTVSLLRGGRPSGPLNYVLIATGYAIQWLGLGIRGKAAGGCPLGNTFEIFQFTAWSAISLYLLIGPVFRSSLLGYFTSCLAAAVTLVSLSVPAWDATRRAHIFGGNVWIELHAAMAVFSYGIFALLALTSVMFLLRHYSLKSKRLDGFFAFLPSIRDLDHIGVRLLTAGVVVLGTALIMGWVFWSRNPGSVSIGKLTTIGLWTGYACALGLRLWGRLVTKRFAWACLVLFAAALLTLPAVDSSRRPYKAAARVATVRTEGPTVR